MKNKEIEHLRGRVEEYERQVEHLNADIRSLNSEMLQNTAAHKEEEIRLQLVLEGLENNIKNAENDKKNEEVKFEEEANSFKEIIENQNKEIKDLRSEMEILIEDNKNLAQRLMHLESYSDKLSEMLDKNQTADDKAREKFACEIKEYRQMATDKDAEVTELTRKVEELNSSVHEKAEKEDQVGKKLKDLIASQKELESESDVIRNERGELEEKLKSVSDAHLAAEKALVDNTEENQVLDKRCSEQFKLMEELHERITLLENENSTLKQSVTTMERGIRLKEGLIAELSRKAGETTDTFSTLKSNVQKAETDKKHYENKVNIFRHEKTMLEKTIREAEDEKSYFRDQVSNLQRLLAKAEDEKEVRYVNVIYIHVCIIYMCILSS